MFCWILFKLVRFFRCCYPLSFLVILTSTFWRLLWRVSKGIKYCILYCNEPVIIGVLMVMKSCCLYTIVYKNWGQLLGHFLHVSWFLVCPANRTTLDSIHLFDIILISVLIGIVFVLFLSCYTLYFTPYPIYLCLSIHTLELNHK